MRLPNKLCKPATVVSDGRVALLEQGDMAKWLSSKGEGWCNKFVKNPTEATRVVPGVLRKQDHVVVDTELSYLRKRSSGRLRPSTPSGTRWHPASRRASCSSSSSGWTTTAATTKCRSPSTRQASRHWPTRSPAAPRRRSHDSAADDTTHGPVPPAGTRAKPLGPRSAARNHDTSAGPGTARFAADGLGHPLRQPAAVPEPARMVLPLLAALQQSLAAAAQAEDGAAPRGKARAPRRRTRRTA